MPFGWFWAKADALILCDSYFLLLFFSIFSIFPVTEVKVPCRAKINSIRLDETIAQHSTKCWFRNLFFQYINFCFQFVLLNVFKAISSLGNVLSNAQSRYLRMWFYYISLYFTSSSLADFTFNCWNNVFGFILWEVSV